MTDQVLEPPTESPAVRLLDGFSLEMTGKDIDSLREAASSIPNGTRVNVTYLAGEEMQTRVAAAAAVRRLGLEPVAHISARRITSEQHLSQFLGRLAEVDATQRLFAVGGDPAEAEGPYEDSLALIRSGLLQQHGAREINIAGYPEGHPDIADEVLWKALLYKYAELRSLGLEGSILTQFAFDSEAITDWIQAVRERGVDLPIRVGVPGPAGVKRLLAYAKRFGVGSSAGIARKYGLSLTNLMSTAGPDRMIKSLAAELNHSLHGDVKLHFYTFGGIPATARWIQNFKEGNH